MPIKKPSSDLVTRRDAADWVQLSPVTLRKMEKKRQFPRAMKLGTRSFVYRRDEIERWLESRR